MHRKLASDELGRLTADEFKKAQKLNIVVVLDNIRSSHNVGAAFRTADSFLIGKIFLCGICDVPPSADIHKSALGAEFSVDWEYCKETMTAIERLKNEGYRIVSMEQAEGSTYLNDISVERNTKYALVFGNEVKGVLQEVVDASDEVVEIPQFGTKHSLNVSVSVGIVLWEYCKAFIHDLH